MKYFFIFTFLVLSFPVYAMEKKLQDDDICRATISTIFDQKVEDVSIVRQQKDVVVLKVPRSETVTVTRFKCAVKGENIIWATETGSWRNTAIDSKISYKTKDNVLVIEEAHTNGSAFEKAFDIKKLITE